MNKKYLLIGIAALSFGSGILYEKWKTERMPYFILKKDGNYFFVDRKNNKEFEAEQISKMHNIVEELSNVINKNNEKKLEKIIEGEKDGKQQ